MVTAASISGTPDAVVARRSGHRSVDNLAKYIRERDLFGHNPLAKAL